MWNKVWQGMWSKCLRWRYRYGCLINYRVYVYPSLENFVGNTPLVRLKRIPGDTSNVLLAKLEGNNPAGSVKDRPALFMIARAEQRGEIKPGDTLIEATSGNTGIALAMAAAMRGYRMILVMPENQSVERRQIMRAFGAELVLTAKEGSMELARDTAENLSAEGKGIILDQFANPDNPLAHYEGTAPDFRCSTFIVRQRIIRIGELIEDDAFAFSTQIFLRIARQFHAAFFRGQHQFRAKCTHDLTALHALIFRHHQYHAIAAHRRRHGQRDTGVTAGRFNQCIARLDLAALLGTRNHEKRGSVLHRTGRIIAFQLSQQHIAGIAWNTLQAHQRGVADEIF